MKLWDKGYDTNKAIEEFTVGNDRILDLVLAKYDVLGSIAHIKMLATINLLTKEELVILVAELQSIYKDIEEGKFEIAPTFEDIHSQIEYLLTKRLGEMGKKIHSARSRNDQVLVDLKLYFRQEVFEITQMINDLFRNLITLSDKHKDVIMPGYTHFQVAMPSSFGLWFGAYAECLVDDLQFFQAAFKITNQNPLGSAAGYGSSFPINRTLTTELLGFEDLNYNVVSAQLGRGKTEIALAFAMSAIANTISKFAMDVCIYNSQNFGFLDLPKEFTTGSSIMPHKKNPDVFELIRAKSNMIKSLPNELMLITSNLPSGYHRDFQILKEHIFPAITELKNCIGILTYILPQIEVKASVGQDDRYKYMFSVDELNKQVLNGVPFRDAYKVIGKQIADGTFNPERSTTHTHEGSINNLCNDKITAKFDKVYNGFSFEKYQSSIAKLLV